MLMKYISSPLSLFSLVVLWILRSRNVHNYHQLSSLSLSSPWWFYGSCGDAILVNITYFGWLVKLRGTAIRFYTHNPVPVNIHS